MPNGESQIINSASNLTAAGVFALLGGLIDYFYSFITGKRKWSFMLFIAHMFFAVFAGYMVALALVGLGYSPEFAGAAAGAAGFLNIRLVDLIIYYARKGQKHDHGK